MVNENQMCEKKNIQKFKLKMSFHSPVDDAKEFGLMLETDAEATSFKPKITDKLTMPTNDIIFNK